jgi:hypothetical protein
MLPIDRIDFKDFISFPANEMKKTYCSGIASLINDYRETIDFHKPISLVKPMSAHHIEWANSQITIPSGAELTPSGEIIREKLWLRIKTLLDTTEFVPPKANIISMKSGGWYVDTEHPFYYNWMDSQEQYMRGQMVTRRNKFFQELVTDGRKMVTRTSCLIFLEKGEKNGKYGDEIWWGLTYSGSLYVIDNAGFMLGE